MILKGRSRGQGSQLARYLFEAKNDEVKVLDIRGTCASELSQEGLTDALKEFDEFGKLTKGEKTLFHLAIAPSDFDRMDASKWQYTVVKAEEALGFTGQPRAVVMHKHKGKEHLHVVWSRVDLETHKLKSDSFTNLKLCNAARDIELDLGLQQLPDIHRGHNKARELTEDLKEGQRQDLERGLEKLPEEHRGHDEARRLTETLKEGKEKDREFKSIEEGLHRLPEEHKGHEKARRLNEEYREKERKESQRQREVRKFTEERGDKGRKSMERIISTAWHRSQDGEEFRERLSRDGLRLVRGDRGPVVMDEEANVYSPARYIEGVKVKDIKEKCADVLRDLPSVDKARTHGRDAMLSPTKVKKLTRMKLRLEFSNDPMAPPRHVYETETFDA